MKKKFFIFFFFIISTLICFSGCQEFVDDLEESSDFHGVIHTRSGGFTDYYWCNGERIPLQRLDNKRFVVFKTSDIETVSAALKSKNTDIHISEYTVKSPAVKSARLFTDSYSATVTDTVPLLASSEVIYSAPGYQNANGTEIGISNLFYVKLKDNADKSELDEMAAENGVTVMYRNAFMPLWYTLSCSNLSAGNALDMANLFYESGKFAAAHPDFMTFEVTGIVNDELYAEQWNLENTTQKGGIAGIDINYPAATAITKGTQETIVAVIDEGVQLDHPDLLVHPTSWDAVTQTSPSVMRSNHATACAGIIGATTNNTIGIAGIAPNVSIMSISNQFNEPSTSENLANSICYAADNGAAVLNNSWGADARPDDLINDAIDYALRNGRGGKGCVVVFSAGNRDREGLDFPANYNPEVIAVGAMNQWGQRKTWSSKDGDFSWGSSYGEQLDIMAPGVKIPTLLPPEDYTQTFNKTSAAAAHVSAVAALILSVNPTLTQKEVVDIIEKSASKVGGYAYAEVDGRPNGTWFKEVGYGLLNAFEALMLVSPPIINFFDKVIIADEVVSGKEINAGNVVVKNNAKLTLKAELTTISGPFTVEAGSGLELSL